MNSDISSGEVVEIGETGNVRSAPVAMWRNLELVCSLLSRCCC
jgi:hypothetical protein